jgi:hypothetical protein
MSGGGAAAQESFSHVPGSARSLATIIQERILSLSPRIKIVPKTQSASGPSSAGPVKPTMDIIVDVSGSTSGPFGSGITVLNKIKQICEQLVCENWKEFTINIISFSNNATKIALPVEELDGEPLFELPRFSSGGITNTHLALQKVIKSKKCAIITDGQASSTVGELVKEVEPLHKFGTIIEIFSVSSTVVNVQNLREGTFPPGMDLLQSIGNSVSKVFLLEPGKYIDQPFLLAQSNTIRGETVPFGPFEIPKGMHITAMARFIIGMLDEDFTSSPQDYCKFGMWCFNLVGRFDQSLLKDTASKFSTEILHKLYQRKPPGVEDEQIRKFAITGVRSIVNQFQNHSNIDQQVAASNTVDRKLSFKEADEFLRTNGTQAQRPFIDFFSPCGVIVSAQAGLLEPTLSLGNFPRSKTTNGLFALGRGTDDQPTRQGLRRGFEDFGMTDADKGPLVTGAMALMKLQHLLLGKPLDSDKMRVLTSLMRKQQGMDVILVKGRNAAEDVRSGPILLEWKAGRNPPLNPTTTDRHIELYGDERGLNFFKANKLFFWAVMMALHEDPDLFNAQLHIYEATLDLLGVGKTWQEVLTYFVNQYKDYVSGTSEFYDLERPAECIIEFTSFNDDDPCFRIVDHVSDAGEPCNWGSYVSPEIQPTLVSCPWCHTAAHKFRWEHLYYETPMTRLNKMLQAAKPFVINVPHYLPCMIPDCDLPNGPFTWRNCKPAAVAIAAPQPVVSSAVVAPQPVVPRASAGGGAAVVSAPVPVGLSILMYAVYMIGSVGSGKSTAREVMVRELESKGWVVTVVNMDAISKRGQQKQANAIIQKAVADGKNLAKSKNVTYVVIFDLCNEKWQPSNPDCFGIKIRGNYICVEFMVNFDAKDTEGYRAWSLLKVVDRPPASAADHFWLNPRDATLSTCIRVSNDKIANMFASRGIPAIAALDTTMSEGALRAMLQPDAERYAKTLLPVEEVVRKFIADNKIGE